jgi:hypothetical protein
MENGMYSKIQDCIHNLLPSWREMHKKLDDLKTNREELSRLSKSPY